MKSVIGETKFRDENNKVITTFTSLNHDNVIVIFDITNRPKLKMDKVTILENGDMKEYNSDVLNTIPEEWNEVLNCMESLTVWYKLDTNDTVK